MIRIPILRGFNVNDVVGEAIVDETKLPSVPNYHLALGFTLEDAIGGNYKLVCLGVVPDHKFKPYIKDEFDVRI